MNRFIAGAFIYVIVIWIIIVIPIFVASIALLITGIKGLKKKTKKTGSLVLTIISSVLLIASSTAIIVPTIWGIQNYSEAEEADKSYNKRFESQSDHHNESEEIDSETVYLIY